MLQPTGESDSESFMKKRSLTERSGLFLEKFLLIRRVIQSQDVFFGEFLAERLPQLFEEWKEYRKKAQTHKKEGDV